MCSCFSYYYVLGTAALIKAHLCTLKCVNLEQYITAL